MNTEAHGNPAAWSDGERSDAQLAAAAHAGHAGAMTQLGLLLLRRGGAEAAFQQGVGWLQAAADRGGAQADAQLAVLAAVGAGLPQDWRVALDHLQRSAERGWETAQQSLRLLASESTAALPDGAGSASGNDWGHIRRSIDIGALIASPPKQPICEEPRIRRIDGFASPALCEALIASARDRLAPARIYDGSTGSGVLHHTRTNTEVDFDIVQTDFVLALLRARIASATGMPTAVMELTKVLHYAQGQAFEPHFDYIDPAVPALAAELATRGQRLATLLLYLNDDHEGGETAFPAIGLRHRGRRGDALMFANVDRSGRVDPKTLHAGLPPTRGHKWLLSQWIRDRVPAPDPTAADGPARS